VTPLYRRVLDFWLKVFALSIYTAFVYWLFRGKLRKGYG
jgi:hypothetical protein